MLYETMQSETGRDIIIKEATMSSLQIGIGITKSIEEKHSYFE